MIENKGVKGRLDARLFAGEWGSKPHGTVGVTGASGVKRSKGKKNEKPHEVVECGIRLDFGCGYEWLWWNDEHARGAATIGSGVCDGNRCAIAERSVISSGHYGDDGDRHKQ